MTPRTRRLYLELISGERRGVLSGIARAGLSLAAVFYALAVQLRNAWYRLAPGAVKLAARPVVSVGNITTGGTGKTPMVVWLARRLAEQDLRVGILTRGYRGRAVRFADESREEAASHWRVEADEATLITRLCPRATVIIDPDRVAGAARAVWRGADVLLLDDGFQHRRLARDLDIVLVDATSAFGFGRALPRGLLREPLWSLRRADLIVLTRVDLVSDEKRARLLEALRRMSGGKPVLGARHRLCGFTDVKGRPVTDIDLRAMQAVVFAGLGNFAAFPAGLARLGATVLAAYEYPDHHDYSDEEIAQLVDVAAHQEANALVTTEKDAVKLVGRWPEGGVPLLAARVEIEFEAGDEAVLADALARVAGGRRARMKVEAST